MKTLAFALIVATTLIFNILMEWIELCAEICAIIGETLGKKI
jgi:hypothetical protein